MEARCVLDCRNVLAEGPVWSIPEQALYFVDIEGRAIQRFTPQSGEHKVWKFEKKVGSLALRKNGGALVALQDAIVFFDFNTSKLEEIYRLESHGGQVRFNDGRCDRQGRFWVGTMDSGKGTERGKLFRVDTHGTVSEMDHGVICSNGLCVSPDGRTLYFADSAKKTNYAYDLDTATGNLSNKRIFTKNEGRTGAPDGGTVDADGFVWSAHWGGRRVIRMDLKGNIEREVAVPVPQPSSCQFGGPNLTTLYITTARENMKPEQLAKDPQSGSIFAAEVGIKGLPEPLFAG